MLSRFYSVLYSQSSYELSQCGRQLGVKVEEAVWRKGGANIFSQRSLIQSCLLQYKFNFRGNTTWVLDCNT